MGTDGLWEGAGRRTPCAERAVILPAVQSLRLACMEGAGSENGGGDGMMGRLGGRRREACFRLKGDVARVFVLRY
jgi:hypothetical protein